MSDDQSHLRFCITPFYVTRQFYYALETGNVRPDHVDIELEYHHSPTKDHVLVCGDVNATTMSMGKFLLVKTISDTYAVPVDPVIIATELTYEEGNGLFVRTDSSIEHPQDLEGKRVGIHDNSMVFVYHNAILEELYDVAVEDVEWVFDTHQGLTDRMSEGDVDAVERVGDWYWNLRTSDDHRLMYDMGKRWRELKGYNPLVHVIAVDTTYADEHPDRVESFVDALQASTAYRDENYESILAAFADNPDGQTEWTGDETVEDIRLLTEHSQAPFTLTETHRQNVRDWMEYASRYGVLPEPIPESRLYHP